MTPGGENSAGLQAGVFKEFSPSTLVNKTENLFISGVFDSYRLSFVLVLASRNISGY
jgi:hypothetical protein